MEKREKQNLPSMHIHATNSVHNFALQFFFPQASQVRVQLSTKLCSQTYIVNGISNVLGTQDNKLVRVPPLYALRDPTKPLSGFGVPMNLIY